MSLSSRTPSPSRTGYRTRLTHLSVWLVGALLPITTFAQQQYPNPLNPGGAGAVNTIPDFLLLVLQGFVLLLTPLVVIFVIYAGYLFVTANGNEQKVAKAKKALLWTLIGAGVIMGAEIMAQVLADTLRQLQ